MLGKNVFLSVLIFTILTLLLGVYLSSFQPDLEQNNAIPENIFPWQIEKTSTGKTRVFGLTIGQSTLNKAEQQFKEKAEITLFMPPDKPAVIEAFFNEVKIAGLKSKMIMSMQVSADDIQEMFKRGARIATLGSGTRKVTLSAADIVKVNQSIINAITYLPSIHLNEKLIEKRFGIPDEKKPDTQSDAVHWLYPDIGVDVVLSAKNKEVIQYVQPEHFSSLITPLILEKSVEQPKVGIREHD